jgi:aspartate racemase
LREKCGVEVIIPGADHRRVVHDIIFNELVHGITKPESRDRYRAIMAELAQSGAEGIVLGCTELMMIIEASDSTVPLFDTTTIHCEAAVEYALRNT